MKSRRDFLKIASGASAAAAALRPSRSESRPAPDSMSRGAGTENILRTTVSNQDPHVPAWLQYLAHCVAWAAWSSRAPQVVILPARENECDFTAGPGIAFSHWWSQYAQKRFDCRVLDRSTTRAYKLGIGRGLRYELPMLNPVFWQQLTAGVPPDSALATACASGLPKLKGNPPETIDPLANLRRRNGDWSLPPGEPMPVLWQFPFTLPDAGNEIAETTCQALFPGYDTTHILLACRPDHAERSAHQWAGSGDTGAKIAAVARENADIVIQLVPVSHDEHICWLQFGERVATRRSVYDPNIDFVTCLEKVYHAARREDELKADLGDLGTLWTARVRGRRFRLHIRPKGREARSFDAWCYAVYRKDDREPIFAYCV